MSVNNPCFLTELSYSVIEDNLWRLNAPLKFASKVANRVITADNGFLTDGASVPRVPVLYYLWGNRCHYEAVIHDWLYQTWGTSKEMADRIFLEAMEVRKKSWGIRYPVYWAVKMFGGKAYRTGPERFLLLNG